MPALFRSARGLAASGGAQRRTDSWGWGPNQSCTAMSRTGYYEVQDAILFAMGGTDPGPDRAISVPVTQTRRPLRPRHVRDRDGGRCRRPETAGMQRSLVVCEWEDGGDSRSNTSHVLLLALPRERVQSTLLPVEAVWPLASRQPDCVDILCGGYVLDGYGTCTCHHLHILPAPIPCIPKPTPALTGPRLLAEVCQHSLD